MIDMNIQLEFDFTKTSPIETEIIEPTKEMPLDVYKKLHHIAYFMEFMERLPDGKVIWDESVVEIYSEGMAEAEYIGLQNDWFHCPMELPKELVEALTPPQTPE